VFLLAWLAIGTSLSRRGKIPLKAIKPPNRCLEVKAVVKVNNAPEENPPTNILSDLTPLVISCSIISSIQAADNLN